MSPQELLIKKYGRPGSGAMGRNFMTMPCIYCGKLDVRLFKSVEICLCYECAGRIGSNTRLLTLIAIREDT